MDAATRGRIGGLTTSARHDPHEYTRPAHAGFRARFEREVDPDGKLTKSERKRRAEAALRAHMIRLAARRGAA